MKIGNEWSGVICKTQLINVVNAFVLNKAIHSTIVNLTIALFREIWMHTTVDEPKQHLRLVPKIKFSKSRRDSTVSSQRNS